MADPRLLKSVGYEGQIPPSQDQFYGQGMSAQPSFLEKMIRKFFNPNDPGIGPQALETGVGAGMVLNEKTIPIFMSKLKQLGLKQEDTPTEFAMKYISAKYPKLFGLPSEISSVHPADMGIAQGGRYVPSTNAVELNAHPGYSRQQATGILAHEITHALQAMRGEKFSGYVPASQSYSQYLDQPVEQQANQAKETAISTLQKFINLGIEHVRNNPGAKF